MALALKSVPERASSAPAAIVTNDTLALRYRPRVLEDLAGHASVVAELRGMFKKQKVPNAIMITGISGIGKTTISRMIARYLNCATGDACGTCASCVAHDAKSPPDYLEINAATNGNKEDIENLIRSSMLKPRHRIRIIYLDEVHRLSVAAANALLKPLEEPPAQTLWILATSEPDKVPNPTAIRGRCAMINLAAPSQDEIAARLVTIAKSEQYGWMRAKYARVMADASSGHVRDAVQILESVGRHIDGLDAVPPRRELARLIEDLAVKAVGGDIDRHVLNLVVGIYEGNPKRVQKAIFDCEDYIALVNKALHVNWFLVGRTFTDRHDKLWWTRLNRAAWDAIHDRGVRLDLDLTTDVHSVITALRSEMQNFAVDAQHLVTAKLTRLAFSLMPEPKS